MQTVLYIRQTSLLTITFRINKLNDEINLKLINL